MAIYQGVNGVNREIKQIFEGVGGVNREIKERWEGVGEVNRQVFVNKDPNILLLLHGDDFIDSSKYNLKITSDNIVINNDGKFGKCFYSDGYGTIFVNNTNLTIDDFTIDFWCNPHDVGSENNIIQTMIGTGTMELRVSIDPKHQNAIVVAIDKDAYFVGTAGKMTANSIWKHVAIVRTNNIVKVYIDGKLTGSVIVNARSLRLNNLLILGIGEYDDRQLSFNGQIDEFTLSNIARWTTNFVPPTRPYK